MRNTSTRRKLASVLALSAVGALGLDPVRRRSH